MIMEDDVIPPRLSLSVIMTDVFMTAHGTRSLAMSTKDEFLVCKFAVEGNKLDYHFGPFISLGAALGKMKPWIGT